MRAAIVLLLVAGCREPAKAPPPRPSPTPASPAAPSPDAARADPDAAAATPAPCADCHPELVDSWAQTPMGRSFAPAAAFPDTPASAVHPDSRLSYAVDARGRFRALETERQAAYAVGSGTHARTWIWRDGPGLFELPLTWFSDGRWALSPGFADGADPGFRRRVEPGCLTCHADLPEHTTIGCGRCHDARDHAAGAEAPPPKVPLDACRFCHLDGAARVLRFEREWTDFAPGQPLEQTVAVFVRRDATDGVSVSSHAGRLARSRCGGGRHTCTACHDPHRPAADRSAPCRDCHAQGQACRGPATEDCAGCHLAPTPAHDVPHVETTDHFIQVRPIATPRPATNDSPLLWVAHPDAEPAGADHRILLGRAYVEVWRNDRQPADAARAAKHLEAGLADAPQRWDGWLALATLRRLHDDVARAREAAERAWSLQPSDPRVALVTGALRLSSGDPRGALAAFANARDDHEVRMLRSRALLANGDPAAAEREATVARTQHPTSPEPLLALGAIARAQRAPDRGASHFEAATRRAPKALRPWLQLGRARGEQREFEASRAAYATAERLATGEPPALAIAQAGQATALMSLGKPAQAETLARTAMTHGVRAPGALTVMGRRALQRNDLEAAMRFLDGALKEHPGDADAWWAMSRTLDRMGQTKASVAAAQRAGQLGHPGVGP